MFLLFPLPGTYCKRVHGDLCAIPTQQSLRPSAWLPREPWGCEERQLACQGSWLSLEKASGPRGLGGNKVENAVETAFGFR